MLTAAALAELLLNRLAGRMIRLEPTRPGARWPTLIDDLGLFVFEFVTVFAVALLAIAITRVVVFGHGHRRSARVSIAVVGFPLAALTSLGVWRNFAPFQFHLQLSFLFITLLLALAVFASPSRARIKFGTFLLWLPIGLHVTAGLAQRLNHVLIFSVPPSQLGSIAESFFIGASLLSPLLFLRRIHLKPIALTAGPLMFGTLSALFVFDRDTTVRLFAYGLGIDLPLYTPAALLYTLAYSCFVFSIVAQIAEHGVSQLRGYGLALIALCGMQLELPFQIATVTVAFFCVVDSALGDEAMVMTREAFDELVRHAAAALGSAQVTVTGAKGEECARFHLPSTPPTAIAIQRRQNAVRELEITVGEVPPREPPFTLQRRGRPRMGPRGEGAAVATGDQPFDRVFQLHDRRDVGAHVLDDATRPRLIENIHGWIGIWPQRGLRYRSDLLPPPEKIPTLITLLLGLVPGSS